MPLRALLASISAAMVAALGVASASAQTIAVADLTAEPSLEPVAGALTLVLRTYVAPKTQQVGRELLVDAVATVGASGKDALAVAPDRIPSALAALGADKWLAGEVRRDGVALEVALKAYDSKGETGAAIVGAPLGDYDALAREASAQASRLLGMISLKVPELGSYGGVLAIGSASTSLARGNAKQAATDMLLVPSSLGAEMWAAGGISAAILGHPEIPLDLRLNAALVSGDLEAGEELAKRTPRDPIALAFLARERLARVDHRAAEKYLEQAKASKHPFVILARAALANVLGRGPALSGHWAELLKREPYLPALAFATSLWPGTLDKKTQELLLAAATAIASEQPVLASSVAAWLVRSGTSSPEVLALLDPLTVSVAEFTQIKLATRELTDEKLKARLEAEIAIREGRLEDAQKNAKIAANLDPANPRAVRVAALLADLARTADPTEAPAPKVAKPLELRDPKRAARVRRLADDLVPMLNAFPRLVPALGRVVLVRRTGSREPGYWPTRVHPAVLGEGLELALSTPPFAVQVATEARELGADPTKNELAEVAIDNQASAVILFGARTDGLGAVVTLLFYSVESGNSEIFRDNLDAAKDHGVVSWNPFFLTVTIGAGALLVLWLVWLVVRGVGTVRLELKFDAAAERPSLSVVVSRRNKCPVVTDPQAHLANVTAEATAGRYRAHNVGAVTEFERIPPGSWYIHVYGTFEKAGETRSLPATTAGTKVKRARPSIVSIDLTPTESEFHILVSGEGGAAAGAVIWLSTHPAKRITADASGKAVVFAPPGEHTLHVAHRDHDVTRKLTAFGSKVTTLHINMVRERRLAEVAEGLELEFESGPGATQSSFPALAEPTPTPGPSPLLPREDRLSRPAPIHGDEGLTGLRRYQAEGELGRGAMGVVYQATDQVLGRSVALKVMSRELRENQVAASMFEQEAKALASLNHPNVVAVYDQGRDGDEMFMVMELVEGHTLEDVLNERGHLDLSDAANIGEQVARSLSYAHSRRVIHRDVKPGNIFIGADGSVKLGDFGLARVLNEVKIRQTSIKGTPLYMAPEQIRGADIDFRADIYALGCTMYEVLAGRPPFIEGEILWHHIYTEPEPLSKFVNVPPEIESLIMKCIAKDKSDRIASADRISEVFGAVRRQA